MKKIGKLTFSPEKIMVKEELINLKGGYDLEPIGSVCYEGYQYSPGSAVVLCTDCLPRLNYKSVGPAYTDCYY